MRKCKLGDIADLCLGKMLDKEKNKGEYEPYLANANVQWGYFDFSNLPQMRFERKEQKRYGLEYGDIVMCEGGEPGRCAIWRNEIPGMKIQKALHRIRITDDNTDYRYLYYWFLIAGKQNILKGNFIETTIKHLTGERLRDIEIELPSVHIQRKIGSLLENIDSKINNNNATISTLESLSKTLYDYYFLQFDFPDENNRPYKSSGGKMEYNAELGREIPAGWKVLPIKHFVDCNNNTVTPKSLTYPVKYLDTSNLTENIIYDIQKISSLEQLPSRARRIIHNNDILISTVRPNLNHYGFIKCLSKEIIASTGFAVLSPKNQVYSSFLYKAITNYDIQKKIDQIAKLNVSSYPSFNPDDLLSLNIAIPADEEIICRFSKKLDKFYEIISKKQQENRQLTALRDFLLPLLMNGQVTFRS